MRRICYVTGTRADFGLMKHVLIGIDESPDLDLSVIVTGMHLLEKYGNTISEIEHSGLNIVARITVALSGQSGLEMSLAMAEQMKQMTLVFQKNRPDIILLLGDRGEMLAAAIVALHLNIPIVHIHGGERSGTIDESIRHAISKIAHFHFVASDASRERLIRMGEAEDSIFITGAPGLDEVCHIALLNREALFNQYQLDLKKALLLILFHPVVQDEVDAGQQMAVLLKAAARSNMQCLILSPNADAGSLAIEAVIDRYADNPLMHSVNHLVRTEYLSFLAYADVLVGNSSSGIIEAASLNTAVVNVGDRQNCRERNANTIDVSVDEEAILDAVLEAKEMNACSGDNVYGDGDAASRMLELLLMTPLDKKCLSKSNAY
ncbi:MAG: UDP-N-acetylglucosamine 2-epimerase (hydrolyzing) [Gammaproteobacteria bacterium]|nr:UDP-N-acetylglucosamine 2-epimerase (hydrolyzing) [Gammaproteobacteria bacterium]